MDSNSPPLPTGNTCAFQTSLRRLEITFKLHLQTITAYKKSLALGYRLLQKHRPLLAPIGGVERDQYTRMKQHSVFNLPN